VRAGSVMSRGSEVASCHVRATVPRRREPWGIHVRRALLADSSLQTGGAEVLVTSTLVLDSTLPVAVVHGDIQVMALYFRDRRVCERRGDSA
jgi:hypothetical protein